MTVDQTGAIAMFEGLGFKAEALLRDHVRDIDGRQATISSCLGHDVAQVRAQMEAYGLPGAVGTEAGVSEARQVAYSKAYHGIRDIAVAATILQCTG